MASSSFRDSINSLGWAPRDEPVNTSQQRGLLSSIQSLNPFGNRGYVQLPTTEGAGAPLPAPSRREEEEGWFVRESQSRSPPLLLPDRFLPSRSALSRRLRIRVVAGPVPPLLRNSGLGCPCRRAEEHREEWSLALAHMSTPPYTTLHAEHGQAGPPASPGHILLTEWSDLVPHRLSEQMGSPPDLRRLQRRRRTVLCYLLHPVPCIVASPSQICHFVSSIPISHVDHVIHPPSPLHTHPWHSTLYSSALACHCPGPGPCRGEVRFLDGGRSLVLPVGGLE